MSVFFSLLVWVFSTSSLLIILPTDFVSCVPAIDFCASYTSACNDLLNKIACPAASQQNIACTGAAFNYTTFVGTCSCGGFDVGSVRVAEDLIDYSVKADTPSLLMYSTTAAGKVDICASYNNICSTLLVTHFNCPLSQYTVSSCSPQDTGFANFTGVCTCGGLTASSARVQELISDAITKSAITTAVTNAYMTNSTAITSKSFCNAYTAICNASLTSILACPKASQTNLCSNQGGQDTFVGTCSCGQWNIGSARFSENIVDSLIKAQVPQLSVLNNGSSTTYSLCASQQSICQKYLSMSGCPAANKNSACVNTFSPTVSFTGTCTCGLNDIGDARVLELFIDSLITGDLAAIVTNAPTTSPTLAPGATTLSPNASHINGAQAIHSHAGYRVNTAIALFSAVFIFIVNRLNS